MRKINVAIGTNRKDKNWKNTSLTFEEFKEYLREPTRTNETEAEYKKLAKSKKDEIKDVGGFVGGLLKNGRRKAENIVSRSLLTLDLDYAAFNVFDSITFLHDYEMCMYSTHSHTKAKPRYRLIIPLDRDVSPEEYQAISRKFADSIGMDQFDDTTYEPCRLMYFPSCSKDAEFIFREQTGPLLSADSILKEYEPLGWQDVSCWPESSRVKAKMTKALEKQEDPLTKEGIIGAFCRTYSINEAIEEFLSDVYIQGKEDRYTYAAGSTSGGLVIYDDKFSYSHHGTDPTSGLLCNAFDLVRIHKFRELDENSKDDTPVNRLPSFTKMCEFAAADKNVLKLMGEEKIQKAKEDFGVVDEDNTEWLCEIEYTTKGEIKSTINNFKLIILNDPLLKGKIAFNEFSNRATVLGNLPWRKEYKECDWIDSDDSGVREYIEKYYGINSTSKITDALNLVFEISSFHPVKDYLNSLFWDGEYRLETLLIDYLGADDNSYVRTVTRKMLVAAVARIFNPGIKFDNMIVLAGTQGIGKSTLIARLGREWFSDSLTTVTGKDAYEQLQGVWLIEMGEMMATKKADIEATKHFLSKTEDIYRVAYGRRTSRFKRQCIFIGTTNDREFLRDRTGNRRFWPVDVGINPIKKQVYKCLDENTVNQIWAEAIELYKKGEELYLTGKEEKEAKKQQDEHSEENAKLGLVQEYLEKLIPDNWYELDIADRKNFIHGGDFGDSEGTVQRTKVCVMEVWVELFNGDPKKLTPIQSREINDLLNQIEGWKKAKASLRFGRVYGQQRAFTRIS